MRLFLSSYKLGNNPEMLTDLTRTKFPHAGIILNAGDPMTAEDRSVRYSKQEALFRDIGISSEEIDLLEYAENPEKLKERLSDIDLIWVHGGNVFALEHAFTVSGFSEVIRSLLHDDRIVYAGYSAGACIAGPSLNAFSIVDEVESSRIGAPIAGLNLVPYTIVPHFQSAHPESARVDLLAEYLQKNKMPFKALRDGEVIIIDGETERIAR